jgi:predicted SAM-dependent methyltransferase
MNAMKIFKSIKSLLRKTLFLPFGYDIVPVRKTAPARRPAPRKPQPEDVSFELQLERYAKLFGEEVVQARRFYNLGGTNKEHHPAWTMINHPSEHYGLDSMDIAWDLLAATPLPIDSDSACIIYSRYTLEHVPDRAVEHFLSEAFRALKAGGFLRLVVPDIDLFYWAYRNGDTSLFERGHKADDEFPDGKFLSNPEKAPLEQRFLWTFASNATTLHADGAPERLSDAELRKAFAELSYAEALNYCTAKCSLDVQRRYPEDHINWFNADKLIEMVRNAGFKSVFRSGCGQSRCPVLRDTRVFDARASEIGLYIEAIK